MGKRPRSKEQKFKMVQEGMQNLNRDKGTYVSLMLEEMEDVLVSKLNKNSSEK